MADKKRPHDLLGDNDADGSPKRIRRQAPSFVPLPSTGQSIQDRIAAQMAAVKARAAALTAGRTAGTSISGAVPAVPPPPTGPAAASSSSGSARVQFPSTPSAADVSSKIAEIKRLQERVSTQKAPTNPYLAARDVGRTSGPAPAGFGLNTAAHPLLAGVGSGVNSGAASPVPTAGKGKDRFKPMQPKFTSIKANARLASPSAAGSAAGKPTANPYLAADVGPATDEGPKERKSRQLKFNAPGKYTAIAENVRREAKLEELKQRIMQSAKKAGIDAELEVSEKAIRREPPPEVEWWDAPLLQDPNVYPADDMPATLESATKIRTPDTLITLYVQHPIPIPAPWDKNKIAFQGLKLTKKEMKKMRKQRRAAEHQDRQDRIRMGLIPPDPPKVKLSNMMRVLTSDAVQDPTKIEAKIRREMHQRKLGHEQANEERKLSKEERREKVEGKREEDEKTMGPQGAVYKIRYLSNPSHRFKVRKNAEQHGLTGAIIFNPNFNLVYVEGAHKNVRAYRRLMEHRINWTEDVRARGGGDGDNDEDNDELVRAPAPTGGEEGEGEPQSLADNYCLLVWVGPVRDRLFKRFKLKACPTDALAKEFLGVMAGYWDTAKALKPENLE